MSKQVAPNGLNRRVDLRELIERARSGSSTSFGQLLEGCRKYLLLIANDALDSGLRPKGGASDLVQETFVEAQRDFVRFTGTTEQELLAWLKEILANRVANHARRYNTKKRDVHREMLLDSDAGTAQASLRREQVSPAEAALNRDEQARLAIAIGRLPQHLRNVIEMRTWEGLSFPQIAEKLDITSEAARKQWGRAVRRLDFELRQKS